MITPDNSRLEASEPVGFEELADRFSQEIRNGRMPTIADYAARFPDHAEAIARLFPVLELMEQKGTPVNDLSESGLMAAEMAQLNALPTIRQLGDYRIVREIGRGGMGIVFEAYQESLGRTVALKLLPSSAKFDDRRQQRFQQEAEASAKLHHTNIVPIFGVGSHDETSYFVMQYIDGQPLDNVLHELARLRSGEEKTPSGSTEPIARADISTIVSFLDQSEPASSQSENRRNEKPGSQSGSTNTITTASTSAITREGSYWRSIAKIGIQVASALEHAHSRQTLHRDIKPSNLLIDGVGSTWVTDFGLAKFFESPDLTRTGEVVGTLRYMSPEQLNGKSDERSDLFALGLTLYEMAALQPAYDATDRTKLMQQALEASPRRLRLINSKIPKDLETIIHKCIAAEPRARYQSATHVVNDLERFIAGEPVLARRINPVQRFAKWCRRRPAIASLIAALAVSLIVGGLGIAWQWQKKTDALELANQNLSVANQQTDIAKKHFQQARESVNRFFTIVSQQRLLTQPGFSNLRKQLLKEALDYHKQFVVQYGDDEELQFELAQSYFHIAEIEASLFANPKIVEGMDEPIRILTELIESNPENTDYRLWLSRCISMKSNIYQRYDLKAALTHLLEAIEIVEDLRTEYPEMDLGGDELAQNYKMMGLMYERMDRATGNTDRSLDFYSKAYFLREEFKALHPQNLKNIVLLAELNRDLGITYRRRGKRDKAIEHYDESMELLRPVVEAHPDNIMARTSLGSIANSIGFLYGRGGNQDAYKTSLEYYEISKDQYQTLSDESPLVIQYKDGLARAALNAGGVHQVQGNYEKALELRSYAAEIRSRLVELNPDAPHIRSSWAVSLNGVGATLRDMGRIEESIEQHRLAHEQHVKVASGDALRTLARLRLIDGVIQISRSQAKGELFAESQATLDTVKDHVQDGDTKPFYTQGREYAMLAGKIGKHLDSTTPDKALTELKTQCVANAKTALTRAAELGFDVKGNMERDTEFEGFTNCPECLEVSQWVLSQFSD